MNFFILLLSLCIGFEQSYAKDFAWRQEDSRPGYTDDVQPIAEQSGQTLNYVENPYKNDIKLSDQIFDATISKEITQRYSEQFGRTEAEIVYERTPYLTNNFSENDSNVFNQEDYRRKQQKFGEFIAKRLTEYHFERKSKTDPTLKAINETKQKVEKVDLSFSSNWKLRLKYKISSNNLTTQLRNPYIDLSGRMELSGKETVVTVQKHFLKTYHFLTDYYLDKPRWDLILRKQFPKFDTSLTYIPFREIENNEDGKFNEQLILAGISLPFPY